MDKGGNSLIRTEALLAFVSSQELQPKYSYTFTQSARKAGDDAADEPSKSEVQAYIFEVLGVKELPANQDQR
jgi:hypothetical protein